MNGFLESKTRWIVLCVCLFLLGCKQESAKQNELSPADGNPSQSAPDLQSGVDATVILQNVVDRYSGANSYHDEAVLYLSYQLEGRNIQEPQRWATTWDRSGKLAAQLFNATIRADGDLLSCYVYDIETANLDDQHLLMPYDTQLPLNQLFRDSIGRHFLGGYAELPLDETDLVSTPKLIPAPLSLLTNQVRNGWLQNPSRTERMPDENLDERKCFVIRCLSQGMTSDVWIDQQTHLLVQMSLPLKLLAGEVVTSPEITDVVLIAKFHHAVLDSEIAAEMFAIEPRPSATPVRKFVPLPETFPCELIGKKAPNFNLIAQNRKPKGQKEFDGKVSTLLWLAGQPSYSAIGQLDSLADTFPADNFVFATIYSDSELKSSGTGSLELVEQLAAVTKNIQHSLYYDPNLAASTALRVKAIPSIIVLDADSKIQFAKALSNKNWLKDVRAAVERVAAGEDVAAEMQREYDRFLDSYHQQLATVSAANLIDPPPQSTASQVSTGTDPNPNRSSGTIRIHPEKIWSNTEFKQAGNIAVLDDPNRNEPNRTDSAFAVFDGWRTVVELDSGGTQRTRSELQLPEGAAANLIRARTDSNGNQLFAVFAAQGKSVYLFDRNWIPIGVYPKNESGGARISDCQLTDLNMDGSTELIVAFDDDSGIHLVDPLSLQGQKISTSIATSIVSHGGDVVIAGEGKIGMLKTGLTNAEDTELSFRRVASLGADNLCGLGVTSSGQWNAVGFDTALKRIWTLSVGSQFFETQIEPIAVSQSEAGEFIWAIADTENAVHLVSGSGKWLGDFQSESQLGGVALSTNGGDTHLVVSNKDGIECWKLNLSRSPMRPVSNSTPSR